MHDWLIGLLFIYRNYRFIIGINKNIHFLKLKFVVFEALAVKFPLDFGGLKLSTSTGVSLLESASGEWKIGMVSTLPSGIPGPKNSNGSFISVQIAELYIKRDC